MTDRPEKKTPQQHPANTADKEKIQQPPDPSTQTDQQTKKQPGHQTDKQIPEDPPTEELEEMGLVDHLEELRQRLTRIAIALVIGVVACYGFAQELFAVLMAPLLPFLSDASLIYTGPAEGFLTSVKLAAFAGLFLTSPYVFYQLWAFIAPGLYQQERRLLWPIALLSAVFFTGGALFGYFEVFPLAFTFFASFETEQIKMLPSIKEYLSLAIKMLFAFGLAFELPLLIFFLARLGLVTSTWLRKKRTWAVLILAVFSAMLTPPDPFSMLLMIGPLLLLYETGIWLAYFFGAEKKNKKEQ